MSLAEKADLEPRATPRTLLAQWISRIIHPIIFPLLTLAVLTQAEARSPLLTARVVAVALLLTSLPISLLVGVQVARGRWSDLDVSVRRQRYLLYPFGLLCLLALTAALVRLGVPRLVVRASVAVVVANLANGIINIWYKVSAHASGAALCATLLAVVFAAVPAVVVAAIGAALAVGWSRVELGRHSRGQVLLGWLVGAGSALLLLGAPLGEGLALKL